MWNIHFKDQEESKESDCPDLVQRPMGVQFS